MSHFTVLVTNTNHIPLNIQLAPFDENKVVPRYVRYTKEQLIAREREGVESYRTGLYATFLADPKKYKEKHGDNPQHIQYLEEKFPQKLNWGDEEFYRDAIEGYKKKDITPQGGVYSTYNPLSKWDWYEIGGRWEDYFLLRSGARTSEALLFEIDWEGMQREGRKAAEEAWGRYEEKLESGEPFHPYFEYGIEKNETREHYIKHQSSVAPFAVLHQGEWYEKGEMGWWAVVSNEKNQDDWDAQFQIILAELSSQDRVSLVDCHI